MSSVCPRCHTAVYFAEKVSSLGKNWHRFCLKCELCNKILSAGGHAEVRAALGCATADPKKQPTSTGTGTPGSSVTAATSLKTQKPSADVQGNVGSLGHDGRPYCHKPCYAVLFGPKGVNIGGVGSYIYDTTPRIPEREMPAFSPGSATARPSTTSTQPVSRAVAPSRTFAGETALCPGCDKAVFFAEKVMSLGRSWHRPCLRCQRCNKTLNAGGHAEHDGLPYCHVPCYGHLFGPKGVNIGDVGCYLYDPCTDKSETLGEM